MKTRTPTSSRGRPILFAIATAFTVPVLLAAILNLVHWQPAARGHGQVVAPARNFVGEQLRVQLADGSSYPWRDVEPRMTLLALPGPDCANHCLDVLNKMTAARITLNQHMPRLRLLYLGSPPAAMNQLDWRAHWRFGSLPGAPLAGFQPSTADSVSALLVESNGNALAYYPAGFDATGLRKDLQKVIR